MPLDARLVRRAWAMMGGLDWSALPIVIEVLDIEDPEWLIAGLVCVRDHFASKQQTR